MDRQKRIKRKRGNHTSFLWQTIDRFTAFIYSLFIFGRVGESLASEDTYCKRSFLAGVFSARNRLSSKNVSLNVSDAVSKTLLARILVFIKDRLAYLKLTVYGAFFAFYGLTSALTHYISMLINGQDVTIRSNLLVIISSAIIAICSIPLLFSGQSAVGAISKSKIMRGIVLDFFDIPEEKLISSKVYGGKEYVLFAVVFAILFGALSYFFTPWYLPIVFLCVIALFLVFSNPEAGVILTIAATPFLQYADVTKTGLVIMISVTLIAYICKLIQRRRVISFSAELSMAFLFCAFIVAGSLFTIGGAAVLWDAISYVIIIIGGFFLTCNLITTQKGIGICTKALTFILAVFSIMGIGSGFYSGISHRISDPVSEQLSQFSNGNIEALFGDGAMLGLLAVIVFPLIFAYALRQKSAKGVSAMMIVGIVVFLACLMCTSYEIIVALIIECLLFWILYSHKSLTFIIIAALPISIAVILYPYAVANWNWPSISLVLAEFMPASLFDSSVNSQAVITELGIILDDNLTGIGAGIHALEALLPAYNASMSADAVFGASVWMQIICWSGVFGLISFVLFVLFLLKRSFRCFARSYKNSYHSIGLALFCGVMVALLLGMVTNIWRNEATMYIFWVSIGLLLSHIRVTDNERQKKLASFDDASDSADTEVLFYE